MSAPTDVNIIDATASDDGVLFPEADRGVWHVLHTKSRQEKVVAQDLRAMGIGYFLPLVRQVRYYGRRKAMAELPMFPGYVFLRGAIEDAFSADRTKRIAQIIRVTEQDSLDWQLRNLHLAPVQKAPLDPFPYLKNGTRVEVRSGPFRGLQGLIEGRTPKNRLILQVEILNQAVSLEIDGSLLDLID